MRSSDIYWGTHWELFSSILLRRGTQIKIIEKNVCVLGTKYASHIQKCKMQHFLQIPYYISSLAFHQHKIEVFDLNILLKKPNNLTSTFL